MWPRSARANVVAGDQRSHEQTRCAMPSDEHRSRRPAASSTRPPPWRPGGDRRAVRARRAALLPAARADPRPRRHRAVRRRLPRRQPRRADGFAPSGKAAWSVVHIARVAASRIAEDRVAFDQLTFLRRLGHLPAPGQAGAAHVRPPWRHAGPTGSASADAQELNQSEEDSAWPSPASPATRRDRLAARPPRRRRSPRARLHRLPAELLR